MFEYFLGQIPLVNFVWNDFDNYEIQLKNKILEDSSPNQIESNIAPLAKKNLWESNFNYLDSNEIFFPLKLWIIDSCKNYINQKNKTNYEFVITESWAHVTQEGGFHLPHYHDNSTWSGIFYLTTNSSGPNNWFLPYHIERKPGLEFSDDRFTVFPKKGNLIIFPSCILHDAQILEKCEERIVIAFNAVCV